MALGDEKLLKIIDGDRGKNYPRKSDFKDDDFCLFMNTKNVRTDGFLFESKMYITREKDESMGKGKLARNDVVLTTRGTIGNIGIYNEDVPYENIRINSGMLIFRPNQEVVTSRYLFELFRSSIMKDLIKRHASGAAQPQLPIKTLINFRFPIPSSLEEQQQIVKKLNSLSAKTKKLEAIYQKKLDNLEELKKSILDKAFKGGL
jgi:type I restriction enzyme S subunit